VMQLRRRGRGVATALLDAACQYFSAQGLRSVKANPRLVRKEPPRTILDPWECTFRRGSLWIERMLMEASGWPKSYNPQRSPPAMTSYHAPNSLRVFHLATAGGGV